MCSFVIAFQVVCQLAEVHWLISNALTLLSKVGWKVIGMAMLLIEHVCSCEKVLSMVVGLGSVLNSITFVGRIIYQALVPLHWNRIKHKYLKLGAVTLEILLTNKLSAHNRKKIGQIVFITKHSYYEWILSEEIKAFRCRRFETITLNFNSVPPVAMFLLMASPSSIFLWDQSQEKIGCQSAQYCLRTFQRGQSVMEAALLSTHLGTSRRKPPIFVKYSDSNGIFYYEPVYLTTTANNLKLRTQRGAHEKGKSNSSLHWE